MKNKKNIILMLLVALVITVTSCKSNTGCAAYNSIEVETSNAQ